MCLYEAVRWQGNFLFTLNDVYFIYFFTYWNELFIEACFGWSFKQGFHFKSRDFIFRFYKSNVRNVCIFFVRMPIYGIYLHVYNIYIYMCFCS